MTATQVGCIFHWTNFQFSDGETADKFFVMLGCKQGQNYLQLWVLPRVWERKFEAGCHSQEGYYHIPGGGKDWFRLDTWLLLARAVEIHPAEFLDLALKGTISLKGQMRPDIANAIRNCLKKCPDVTAYLCDLL